MAKTTTTNVSIESGPVLRNRWLEAAFCSRTGNLTRLAPAGGAADQSLVAASGCRYLDGETWVSEQPQGNDRAFESVSLTAGGDAVESVLRSDKLIVRRRYSLSADSPLLACEFTVEPAQAGVAVGRAAIPRIECAPEFNNIFEDEDDLYFDGEELPGGQELPCWRVLFRAGHREGLMVATRRKLDMSHFQFLERGFDIRPDVMTAYSSHLPLQHRLMTFTERACHTGRFELGPWQRERHDAILAAARLNQPVDAGNPTAEGEPMTRPDGVVMDLCDIARADQVNQGYTTDTWRVVDLPFCLNGRALYAGPSTRPPPLAVAPGLSGLHRVFVGIGHGDGVAVSTSEDPLPTYRLRPGTTQEETPFTLKLSGRHRAFEADLGVRAMDGLTLRLSRHPGEFAFTVLDYIRFVPLGESEAGAVRERQAAKPRIRLSGFNDIPDIACIVAGTPEAYASNLRDHARCGVDKVYWRIDGQCSDFPSTHNTMRYVSAKTHGVYTPMMKAYGRLLKRCDALQLAVDAGRKYGLEIYGWMRFNNYSGNVQSDFFKQNPQFREEGAAAKLCLAFPEVRRHKIDILVEAAQYGLSGLSLGFLRHPPVLAFAPVLVEGYRKRYGVPPPRDPASPDPRYCRGLPPDDEAHVRWFQYRADFLTLFGRELRAALLEKGLERVKVSLWVRPNHCRFDGIDVPAWLKEGLCDEIVADDYSLESWPTSEWKSMVQASARLYRGISAFDYEGARRIARRAMEEGYDGLCTYESDQAVLDSRFIDFFDALRGPEWTGANGENEAPRKGAGQA
jgi:hypothetical protein